MSRELAPYFKRLAGLVVLSPIIGEHVVDDLELAGISGLVGHQSYFAEETSWSTPSFIEGGCMTFREATLQSGDWVSLRSPDPFQGNTRLSERDKKTLTLIRQKLEQLCPSETDPRLPVFTITEGNVPASSDSWRHRVGLFRSEVAASGSPNQMELITQIITNTASAAEIKRLETLLFCDYKALARVTSLHSPVCFRLFDFRIDDHFSHPLQKTVAGRVYQGGEALRAYPRLYTLQLKSLFSGFLESINAADSNLPRLDIMMPSLRSIEDVERFAGLVGTVARDYTTRPMN